MLSVISHRGPDDAGHLVAGPVGLANARLAVIDPAHGHQPMHKGDCSITYNGEIYNHADLRVELQGLGHGFLTKCDTEVVITAYLEWGEAAVDRLRGMFAFAIADFRERKVLLARDHFGIKPLHYRIGDGFIAFASELNALRQVSAPDPVIRARSIESFLRYQYIPAPSTIYHDCFKLLPANRLTIGFDGIVSKPKQYWRPHFAGKSDTREATLDEAREVIRESVHAHLVSDVPVGVLLSGGIDSTAVAWMMRETSDRAIPAFCVGFEEEGYSEIKHAEVVSSILGLDLETDVISADRLETLPDLVARFGEPFGDPSALAMWFVSRLARRQLPVVLSGDGGDEMFAGYDTYSEWSQIGPLDSLRRIRTYGNRTTWRSLLSNPLRPRSLFRQRLWESYITFVSEYDRNAIWRPEYHSYVTETEPAFEQVRWRDTDRLSAAQSSDLQIYLASDLMFKSDVASMAHGLEVRTPLIDRKIFQLSSRLPARQKIGERDGTPAGKVLLRQLLETRFPAELVHRRKQGFGVPRREWFLPGAPYHHRLREKLLDNQSALNTIFRAEAIRRHFDSHSQEYNNSAILWLLLILAEWLDQNDDLVIG